MRAILQRLILAALLLLPGAAFAADRFFNTSDGVRLHYTDSGPPSAPIIVFVPGWTMPAWIFQPQIDYFSRRYRVVALDPRGQGSSDAPASGYEPFRRGADIAELIQALGGRPVVLAGWSLGVLDALAYVHQAGDAKLLCMVLIDNSVGEDPPPPPGPRSPARRAPPLAREGRMARFVRGMFRRPPDEATLDRLTEDALRTPPDAAAALLAYPVPRSFWRVAVYQVHKPILYIVRPGLTGQAGNLTARHPGVQAEIYADAGHALFVDDAGRFNADMQRFLSGALPEPRP